MNVQLSAIFCAAEIFVSSHRKFKICALNLISQEFASLVFDWSVGDLIRATGSTVFYRHWLKAGLLSEYAWQSLWSFISLLISVAIQSRTLQMQPVFWLPCMQKPLHASAGRSLLWRHFATEFLGKIVSYYKTWLFAESLRHISYQFVSLW